MSSSVFRLLGGNDTLYNRRPSEVAVLVRERLNGLSEAGFDIISITPLPDYHSFGADGGVKDVFFLCTARTEKDSVHRWAVSQLIPDRETLYNVPTPDIHTRLAFEINEISRRGSVRHIIALTDSHNFFPMAQGIGGQDGTKNILLCWTIE